MDYIAGGGLFLLEFWILDFVSVFVGIFRAVLFLLEFSGAGFLANSLTNQNLRFSRF